HARTAGDREVAEVPAEWPARSLLAKLQTAIDQAGRRRQRTGEDNAAGIFRCCQECHYRVGDSIGGAPGQVVTCALDELQAGVRQCPGEPAGGVERNQGVAGVGEDEDRRLDQSKGVLQLAQFAQEGALLGQECAPQRAVLAARMAPDLPVDVLARAQRAATTPADPGEPGTGDPWRQPPGDQRAELPCTGCGEQPVPAVQAAG